LPLSQRGNKYRKIIRLIALHFLNLEMNAEKLLFAITTPLDRLLNLGEKPIWLPSFNIFRNKQDDILSTMNRPMMEGVRLCLAA